MPHLILAILAIALLAAISTVTINYLPTDMPVRVQVTDQIKTGNKVLKAAAERYFEEKEQLPEHIDELTPHYAFLPSVPGGTQWRIGRGSYDSQHRGVWACLEGEMSDSQRKGVRNALRHFSYQTFSQGDTCGLPVDRSDKAATNPKALTFWLMLDTHKGIDL